MKQRRTGSRTSGLVMLGLIVFLLADILLVGWALTANRDAGPPSASSTSRLPTETPTDTPPPRTPSPEPTASVPPPTRIVAPLDGDTAWRSEVGSCPATPVSPDFTTDGGETWSSSDLAGLADVSGVVAIQAVTEEIVTVVGLDAESCSPVHAQSYVAGNDWMTYPERLATDWYVDPADRHVVHSPAGAMSAPCDAVLSLAFRNDSAAAVLCGNGSVFRTGDAGATWASAATPAGPAIVAIGASADGFVLAATGGGDCAGVAVLGLPDDSPAADDLGCVPDASPSQGNVAIGAGGDTIWLWAGPSVARSSDGGATWR